MTNPKRPAEASSDVPFQARVASVALITTVAVLLAACASFMLQQWAVSREESRLAQAALNKVVVEIAAPALKAKDIRAAKRAVSAAAAAPGVVAVTLVDSRGRVVANHETTEVERRKNEDTIRTDIVFKGEPVGVL